MKKILVTGATGTLGRIVTDGLKRGGCSNFVAATRSSGKAGALKRGGIEAAIMDIRSGEGVKDALRGVEKVFLLTPFSEGMVSEVELFTEEALARGVGHIVRLSGLGAGSEDSSDRPELVSIHNRCEDVITSSGIDYTFLRPNTFMQNYYLYFGSSIRGGSTFSIPAGLGRVSFVDGRDIGRLAVDVLLDKGGAECHIGRGYSLTGPEALSNYEVADIISSVAGRPVSYIDLDPMEAREALLVSGRSPWFIDLLIELDEYNKGGYSQAVSGDIEEVTGDPATHFRDFAEEYAGKWREEWRDRS